MSQQLPNSIIDSAYESKKHVLFNQSTQNAKFYKYISGDKLVYDYYIVKDPTAPVGSTFEYAQIYYRDRVAYVTAPFLSTGEVLAGIINASGISIINSSTFGNHVNILSGGLHVTGNVSFNGDLYTQDNTHIGGNLSVQGNLLTTGFATFSSGLYIQNGLSLSGVFNVTLQDNSLNIESINRTGTINIGSSDLTRVINIGCTNTKLEQINIGVGSHAPGDPTTIITIGSPGDIVNINASANIVNVTDYQLLNKHLIINGISGSVTIPIDVTDVGILFSNGIDNYAGNFVTDSFTGNYFRLKAPNNDWVLNFPILTGNARVVYEDLLTQQTNVTNLYATGNLDVLNTNIRSDLMVHGNTIIEGGATLLSNVSIADSLSVGNSALILGGAEIYQNLLHNGTYNHNGTLNQTGNVSIDGTVLIVGNTTFTNANVSLDKTLKVGDGFILTGNATFANSSLLVEQHIHGNSLTISTSAEINAGLTVSGGAQINGDVRLINSDVSISGSLSISGDMSLQASQFNIDSNLSVGGNITANQNLSVNGDTLLNNAYIQGNLITTGNSTFVNNVYIADKLEISGRGLGITGNVTMSNNLTIGNSLDVFADLRVTGGSEFFNYVTIHNTTIIKDGGLYVTGDSTFNNSVFINDKLNTHGIVLTGNATFVDSHMYVSGQLDITGGITISGSAILNGFDLGNISKGLNITGNVTFSETIVTISGIVNIKGEALNVTGNVTFDNTKMSLSGILGISGEGLIVTGNATMSNTVSISALNVQNLLSVSGDVFVTGNGYFTKSLFVSGLNVSNTMSISGDLIVTGQTRLNQSLFVSGINVSNNINVSGNLIVTGQTILNQNLTVSSVLVLNNMDVSGQLSVSGNVNFGSAAYFGNGIKVSGGINATGVITANNGIVVSGLLAISGNGLIVTGQSLMNNSLLINSKFRYINTTFKNSPDISSININYRSLDVSPDELWSAFVYKYENIGVPNPYLGLLVVNNINITSNNVFPQFQENLGGPVQLNGNFDDLRIEFNENSDYIYLYYLFNSNLYYKYFSRYDNILKWRSFELTGIGIPSNLYGPFDINTYPDVPPAVYNKSTRFTTATIDPTKSFSQVYLNYTGFYLSGMGYIDSNQFTVSGNMIITGSGLSVESNATFNNNINVSGNLNTNNLFVTGNTTFLGKISMSGDIVITGSSINMGSVNIAAANIGILVTDQVAVANPVFSTPVRFYSGAAEIADLIPESTVFRIHITQPNTRLSLADDDNVNQISMGLGAQTKDIYIGSNNDTIYIGGTLKMAQEGASTNVSNLNVSSKYFTVNVPAALGTGIQVNEAGLQICNGITLGAGYILTDRSVGDHFIMKAPRPALGATNSYELSFPTLSTTSTVLIKDDATNTLNLERIFVSQSATFNNYLKLNGTLDVQGQNHSISGVVNMNTINLNTQANLFNANINNNLTVAKNANFNNSIVSVSGQLNISGRGLTVTGAVTFANLNIGNKGEIGFLEVLSRTTFNNDIAILEATATIFAGYLNIRNGGLFVSGGPANRGVTFQAPVTVENILGVSGGLIVTGNSTFTTLTVTNTATIYDLQVLNNMTFAPNNTISGNLLISGSLNVTGGSTFQFIRVGNTGTIETFRSNTLLTTGNATFKSTVDILGNVIVSGGIFSSGINTLNSLTVHNGTTMFGNVYISGNSVFGNTYDTNNTQINGQLNVSGFGLVVTGSTTFQYLNVQEQTLLNILTVSGDTNFVNSTIDISGLVKITGGLIFTGNATMNSVVISDAYIGNLNILSQAINNNGIFASGNVTFNNTILTVSGNVLVTNETTLQQLEVLDDTLLQGNLQVALNSTFGGDDNHFINNVEVDGKVTFNNNVFIGGNLDVDGAMSFNDTINVNGIGTITTAPIKKFQINTLQTGSTIDIGTDENTDNVFIGANDDYSKTVTIGAVDSIINLVGDINYLGTINANDLTIINGTITNQKIYLNTGATGNVNNVGIFISDGTNNEKGYIRTDPVHGDYFVFKAPYGTQYELYTPVLTTTSTVAVIDDLTETLTLENLVVNGSFSISGTNNSENMNIADTLYVNHLSVSGNTTFSTANIFASGLVQITGSLVVSGDTIIERAVIPNLETVDLIVNGNTTFDNSNIYVSGFLNISGGIIVTGLSLFDNLTIDYSNLISLNVLGNATFSKGISVSGGINAFTGSSTFNTINLNRLNTISLLVTGNSTFNNIVSISGGLNAMTGAVTFNNVSISNVLYVSGNTTFNGPVTISGQLNLSGGLVVTGNSIFTNLTINNSDLNNLNVLNQATFGDYNNGTSTVSIFGTLNVSGSGLQVTGAVTMNNINVSGRAHIHQLFVSGLATFNNGINLTGSITMFNGNLFTNNIIVSNNSTFTNLVIKENFIASGNSTFNSNLYIDKELLVNNGLFVTSNVTFNNSILNISGDAYLNDNRLVTINQLEDTNIEVHLYQLDNTITDLPTITGNHLFLINNTIPSTITGVIDGIIGTAYTIISDTSNDLLYLGGSFISVGGIDATGIALYDSYNNIWSNIGDGIDGTVYSIVKNNELLFIGGTFLTADTIDATGIVLYNINTDTWSALGDGIDGTVNSLAIDSDNLLYVGGTFVKAGAISATGIAIWDNDTSTWTNLDDGINGIVNTIAIDSNNLVYVGGSFTKAGSINATGIAIWDNNTLSWTALGSGVNGTVNTINIDSNNIVYVGGTFIKAGSINRDGIAVWDNESKQWSGLPDEIHGTINTIKFDALENVYIAGSFLYDEDISTQISENIIYYDKSTEEWTRLNLDGIYGVKANVVDIEFDKYNNFYMSSEDITQAGVISSLNSLLKVSSNNYKILNFAGPLRNLDESGNLTITKQMMFTKLGENLNVYFNADSNTGYVINKSITGFNTLYVSGNAQFYNSTVTISGGLEINGTGLIVTGNVIIDGDLTVEGEQTIGQLRVLGNATFDNDVFINNNLVISAGLDVTGTVDIRDDLTISGSLYLSGTEVIITANTILGGDLYVSGTLDINSDVTITGDIYQDGLFTLSGGLEISGDGIIVTGDAIFDECDLTISGSLTVTGNVVFDESDITISGSLLVTGDAIFDDCDLSISGSLTVTGDSVFNDGTMSLLGNGLFMNNANVTFSNVNVFMRGLFSQTGGLIASGSATFSDHMSIANGLYVTGNVTFVGDSLSISNNVYIDGGLNVTGNTTFNNSDVFVLGNVYISGNFVVSGTAFINGADLSSFDNGISVSGAVTFNNAEVSISGGLVLTGNATFLNDLYVDGNGYFNKSSTSIRTFTQEFTDSLLTLNNSTSSLDTSYRRLRITGSTVTGWNPMLFNYTGSSYLYNVKATTSGDFVYYTDDTNRIYRYNTTNGVITLIGTITSGFVGTITVCRFTNRVFIGSVWTIIYNGVTYSNLNGGAYWNGSVWTGLFGGGSGISGGNLFSIVPISNTQIYLGGGFTSVNGNSNSYHLLLWDYTTFTAVNQLNTRTTFPGLDGGNLFIQYRVSCRIGTAPFIFTVPFYITLISFNYGASVGLRTYNDSTGVWSNYAPSGLVLINGNYSSGSFSLESSNAINDVAQTLFTYLITGNGTNTNNLYRINTYSSTFSNHTATLIATFDGTRCTFKVYFDIIIFSGDFTQVTKGATVIPCNRVVRYTISTDTFSTLDTGSFTGKIENIDIPGSNLSNGNYYIAGTFGISGTNTNGGAFYGLPNFTNISIPSTTILYNSVTYNSSYNFGQSDVGQTYYLTTDKTTTPQLTTISLTPSTIYKTNLSVTGNLNLDGNLSVTGNLLLNDSLGITNMGLLNVTGDLVITGRGNIGIGAIPSYKLHVSGDTRSNSFILAGGSATYVPGSIFTDANWGFLFRSARNNPNIAHFSFADFNDNKLLTIDFTGNVGIGTAYPSNKLFVVGSDITTNNYEKRGVMNILESTPTQSSTGVLQPPVVVASLVRNGRSAVVNSAEMDFRLSCYEKSSSASRTQCDIHLHNGFYGDQSVNVMTLRGNGNVGIGTSSPQYKLDVNGDLRVSGSIIGSGSGTTTTSSTSIDNITVPASINGTVQCVQIRNTFGAYSMDISVVVSDSGFSVTKRYIVPMQWAATPHGSINTGQLYRLVPISDSGSHNGNNFELLIVSEYNSNGFSGAWSWLRIRRTSGTGGGVASITVSIQSDSSDKPVVTAVNSTNTDTGNHIIYPYTQISQVGMSSSVGIGTTNPTKKLHIEGTDNNGIYLNSTNGNAIIELNTPQSYGNISMKGFTSNPWDIAMQFTNYTLAGLTSTTNLFVWTCNTNTYAMVLNNSGNLGIGTSSPRGRFSVQATDTVGSALPVIFTSDMTGRTYGTNVGNTLGRHIRFEQTTTTGTSGFMDMGINNNLNWFLSNPSSVQVFTVANNGCVGIGTTSMDSNSLLTIRNGNGNLGFTSNQIVFNYNTGSVPYAHAIKSRHNAGSTQGNAMDFYVWNYGVDSGTTVGTRHCMTLESGNCGIGTTAPEVRLDVNGKLLVRSFTAGQENGIFFREGCTTTYIYNMSILSYDHGNAGTSPDGLSINAFDGISFCTASNTRNEAMRIVGWNNDAGNKGYIGIGTTNPSFKLSVHDPSVPIFTNHTGIANPGNYPAALFAFKPLMAANETHVLTFGQSDSALNRAYVGFNYQASGSTSNYLTFGFFNANNLFNINGSGNVGIGVTNPSEKLDMYTAGNNIGPAQMIRNDGSILRFIPHLGNNFIQSGVAYTNDSRANLHFTSMLAATYHMTILGSNGNVGIGTSNPIFKLGVFNNIDGETAISVQNGNANTNAYSILRIASNDSSFVIFKNSTTRTADGGVNTATIRNDNGSLRIQALANGGLWGQNTGIFLRPAGSGVTCIGIGAGTSNTNCQLSISDYDGTHDPTRYGIVQITSNPTNPGSVAGQNLPSLAFVRNLNFSVGMGYATNSNVFGIGYPYPVGTFSPNWLAFSNGNIGIRNTNPLTYLHFEDANLAPSGFPPFTTVSRQQSRILYYTYGTENWCGQGVDTSGNFWLRTGTNNATSCIYKFLADGSGGLSINYSPTSIAGYASKLTTQADSSGYWLAAFNNTTASGGECIAFCSLGTKVGSITINSSSTGYNTTSDYRLKTNVEPLEDGLDTILKLKPKRFNWLSDLEAPKVTGFIAHEVDEVISEVVTGEKDAVNDDGTIDAQVLDQSKLIPSIVSSIQQLYNRISNLDTSNTQTTKSIDNTQIDELSQQLENNNNSLQQQLVDKEQQIQNLTSKVDDLTSKLTTSEAKVDELTSKLAKLISVLGVDI